MNSVWACVQFDFSKWPLKLELLDIYLTKFWESVIWEIQKCEGHPFFLQKFKIQSRFQKGRKKFRKSFLLLR